MRQLVTSLARAGMPAAMRIDRVNREPDQLTCEGFPAGASTPALLESWHQPDSSGMIHDDPRTAFPAHLTRVSPRQVGCA